MKLSRITSLVRPLDPDYPTNLVIGILTLLIMLVGTFVQGLTGMAWLQALMWGVGAGFTIFLAWALGRELDPDHDYAAFVGVALALAALFVWQLPSIAVLFWTLLMIRVVNRTFGFSATPFDSIGVLAIGAWLSFREHSLFIGMTTIGLLLDALIKPVNRRQYIFGAMGAVITMLFIVLRWAAWGPGGMSTQALGLAALMAVILLPVVIRCRNIQTVGDESLDRLEPIRVIAGQLFVLVIGLLVAFLGGMRGLEMMLSFWAAVVGVTLYLVVAFVAQLFSKIV